MAAHGTVTRNADGTVRFTATCTLCGRPVARWQAGEFVQAVFPERSASEREVLVSGSHAECFDAAFPAEEEENDEGGDDDREDIPAPQDDGFDGRFSVSPRGWPADGSDFGRYDFPNLGSPGPDRDGYREW